MPSIIQSPVLRNFLAVDRIRGLARAYRAGSERRPREVLGSGALFMALAIALLPTLTPSIHPYSHLDLPTVLIGLSACFAVLYRIRHRIPFQSVRTWNRSMNVTHTAFALGCIPLAAIMLIHPASLYSLGEITGPRGGTTGPRPGLAEIGLTIAAVSAWAALTEEFIFRGLLISVIRRWRGLRTQRQRDLLAVGVSATLFSLSHFDTWGPWLSGATLGLGVGFGIAYIAIHEEILPLIVYHAVFDFLSIGAAILLYKT